MDIDSLGLSEGLQQRLAGFFIETVKVKEILSPLTVVSMSGCETLAKAIASPLKKDILTFYDNLSFELEDKESLQKKTVLLVEAVLIHRLKLDAALSSLTNLGVSKVLILAPILYKPVLYGNKFPLTGGIFLARLETVEEVKSLASSLEEMSDGELSRRLFLS